MRQKTGRKRCVRFLLTLAMAVGLLPGMTSTAHATCFPTGEGTYTVKYSSDGTSVDKIVHNYAYGDDIHQSGASGDYVGKTYNATYNLIFTKVCSPSCFITAGWDAFGAGSAASGHRVRGRKPTNLGPRAQNPSLFGQDCGVRILCTPQSWSLCGRLAGFPSKFVGFRYLAGVTRRPTLPLPAPADHASRRPSPTPATSRARATCPP